METAFEQARESLDKEIDIVRLLRQQRKIDAALKLLLTADQLKRLKQESRYFKVDPKKEEKEETPKQETPLIDEKKQSSTDLLEEKDTILNGIDETQRQLKPK